MGSGIETTELMLRKISTGVLCAMIVAALAAIAGIVFVVSYDYPEPTVTGRFFAFCKLILPLNLLALPVLLGSKYRFTLTDLLVLLYTLYFILHGALTESPAENRQIVFICLAQFYFLLRIFRSFRPRTGQWALLLLFLAGCGQAILGLKQIYGFAHSYHGLYSITGSFFNPGPYGGYMAFVFCLSSSHIVRQYTAFERICRSIRTHKKIEWPQVFPVLLYAAGCACMTLSFLVIPASMSRSAWVAVAGTALLILVVEYGLWGRLRASYNRHRIKTLGIGSAVILLVAAGIVGVYVLKKGSADGRLLAWEVTMRAIAEHPAGTGAGTFGGAYAEAQSTLFREGRLSVDEIAVADSPTYAFNEYLQITLEQGWPGILFLFAILLLSFRKFRSARNEWQYALFALLLFALTSYPFRILPLLILLVMAVGLQSNGIDLSGRRWSKAIGGILLCGTLLFNFQILPEWPKKEAAYREWKSMQMLELYDGELADDYGANLDELAGESAFLFEYGHTLNKIGRYAESNRILEQGSRQSSDPMFYNVMGNNYRSLGEYAKAEAMYEQAFSILPNRLYPLYLLTKLYYEQGDTLKASRAARRVLEFNPKVESPATNDMKKEIRRLVQ